MAYGNNNFNGGYQKPAATTAKKKSEDSNTKGVRLTNYDQMKYLDINYWKKACSIDVGVIPQGAAPGTGASWSWNDAKPTIHLALTFATLTTLETICDEVWESIKKTGSFTNVGAPCGSNFTNMVEINNGSTLNMPEGIYIVLYKDRDQSGKAQLMEVYPCSTRTIERNYDPSTGNSVKDINKTQDFKDFRRCIHEAVSAFTMAYAHSVQEVQNLDRLSVASELGALCQHFGIDVSKMDSKPAYTGNNSGGARSGGNSGYRSGGYQRKSYGGNSNGYGRRDYNPGKPQYSGSHNDTPPWASRTPNDAPTESMEINLSSPEEAFDNFV